MTAALKPVNCPICRAAAPLHDVVDLNKSCEEARGKYLPLDGTPVYYALCGGCGFCFAPELMRWDLDTFAARIYNDGYAAIDPDYADVRPRSNAQHLHQLFGARRSSIRHLDYGGGNGRLSDALRHQGWSSQSYDPFVQRNVAVGSLGRFELVTAYEVFEHVPDVNQLMTELKGLLADNGVLFFTTLLSDGQIKPNTRLGWWYASPRNGHISLFSRKALELVARQHGFNFGSASAGLHLMYRQVPPWASDIIKVNHQAAPA